MAIRFREVNASKMKKSASVGCMQLELMVVLFVFPLSEFVSESPLLLCSMR